MALILEMLMITTLITFVIDISGFFDAALNAIWKTAFKNRKQPDTLEWKNISFFLHPLECSTCGSWWLLLLFLILTHNLTILNVFIAGMMAFLTPIIKDLLIMVKDIFTKIINLVYKLLKLDRY